MAREKAVKQLRVNGYDMAYIEAGEGSPLVCVHGSLCDYRIWAPVIEPLSARHRVVALSLRHYYPEAWDGSGLGFTIAQHVADVIGFIEGLGLGPVHLMGHSRGGHISFRVAGARPDLLCKLVLAEPGGTLDPSLAPKSDNSAGPQAVPPYTAAAAAQIAAGDIDGGLMTFLDAIEGPGAWQRLARVAKDALRDNARTLLGQINEQRQPYTRGEAEAISLPTLFIGGADTTGWLPVVLRVLAVQVPDARTVMLPSVTHLTMLEARQRFSAAVLDFLADPRNARLHS